MPLPSQVQLSNTFGQWVNTTNQIITAVGNTSEYILVAQNATPATSSGNVSINGTMTIVTVTANGTVTANVFSGNGVSLTTMNASALATGTVPDGRLSGTYTLITANNSTYAFGKSEGALNVNSATTATQATNATNLNSQPGSYYTNASNLATGTVPLDRLTSANTSANGVVDTNTQTFVGNKTFQNTTSFSNTVSITGAANALGTLGVSGNATFAQDVTITGSLTVSGTTTYINTTNLQIGDNIIALNADLPAITAPSENAGIEINRGSSANTYLRWNEMGDNWEVTSDGTNYGTLLTTISTTGINASALSTGTVPLARLSSASASANGVVDTTTQSFAGAKTFTGATTLSSTLLCSGVATVNAKMTLNTTNGRFVLPVGTNLWAT